MSGKEVHELLTEPITCHCWNGDRTKLAISPNNNEIHIYTKKAGKWEVEHKLTEHTSRVTGIDWAPKSGSLVTCAADRNAYVWKFEGGAWKPVLVILRINRAATIVKWSPLENKFAVGSGARIISVCYFDKDNDWWVSKHIKKPLRSTVTSLDWHPNNYLIAAGCSDFKARVFSTYVKEIEEKPNETVWGKKMPFGNVMAEFSNGGGGWVHGVSFSPSGNKLAWVGHDSSVSVVNMAAGGADSVAIVKHQYLPYLACQFITENSIVTGGYDCYPVLWSHDDNNQLTFINRLDQAEKKTTGQLSAMEKFKGMDKRATAGASDTALDATHQNSITQISKFEVDRSGNTNKFCTSGVDGRLVIWNCKSLESQIAGLRF
ncbi:actin-related protein 2/3 complex subunit 1A-like [Gigantopelta aegis]|uniref:actin-related protein 2/3 complex subunit 1A-like n=1 Tax=Gigantopelta aegis TaxID=1735272 RepID=UPI001B889C29|nr:actin-related protein 2/3 complex subunit 1A-like [Gigantopelta aegis]